MTFVLWVVGTFLSFGVFAAYVSYTVIRLLFYDSDMADRVQNIELAIYEMYTSVVRFN